MISFSCLSAVFTRLGIGNNVKMTTDSQLDDSSKLQLHQELLDGNEKHTNESTGAIDMMKRDRFELLSAYLDGEVTAAERRQVEKWLADDPTVQRLYARLLKLRQSLRTLPVPQPHSPVETVEQVLARLRRRTKLVWVGGGAAMAACVIGAVSGLQLGGESRMPHQMARQSIQKIQPTPSPDVASPLMVAINNPVIPIPKAAEASPENPVNEVHPLLQDIENDIN